MPACPPRPETGTGSGGATGCGYATALTAYDGLAFHHRILINQPALARRDENRQLISLVMSGLTFHHRILACQVWAWGLGQGFKGYNRWTPLTLLIKIRNTRHTPLGETA